MAVSRKVRFEVFKRDKFTCQYCGKAAPDVVLNADHMEPKSKGGSDDILNLITSCFDCNQGKKAIPLSDNSLLKKQKAQLDLLQERREQIEMMLEWQRSLADFQNSIIRQLAEYWNRSVAPYELTDSGIEGLRKLLKRFRFEEIVDGMNRSVSAYLKRESGEPIHESVVKAWEQIGMFCTVARRSKDNPHIHQIYYIRGILRKRLSYVNEREIMGILETAIIGGVSPGWITWLAKDVSSYTKFRNRLWDALEQVEKGGD